MTNISVIIPTLGRPTLERALHSAQRQLGPHDEIIVVGDGPTPGAHWVKEAAKLDPRLRYFEYGPTRCWGAAQYDHGMDMADGEWCMFLPDDDIMAPGAIDAVREAVLQHRFGVHVFACQMNHWGGRILKGSKNVCEVTANQIVVPVEPMMLPRWADHTHQTFDHAYLTAMLTAWGQEVPYYHDTVICIADQQNNGRVF